MQNLRALRVFGIKGAGGDNGNMKVLKKGKSKSPVFKVAKLKAANMTFIPREAQTMAIEVQHEA
jgi:hypothetical protein